MIISTEEHVENVEVPLSFHLVNHTRLRYTKKKEEEKKERSEICSIFRANGHDSHLFQEIWSVERIREENCSEDRGI